MQVCLCHSTAWKLQAKTVSSNYNKYLNNALKTNKKKDYNTVLQTGKRIMHLSFFVNVIRGDGCSSVSPA